MDPFMVHIIQPLRIEAGQAGHGICDRRGIRPSGIRTAFEDMLPGRDHLGANPLFMAAAKFS